MILAEKITMLRKKNGWSQEELAEQLGISRQSVSKWESSASIPDLDKILKMSALFGVSTDYLLKDELEEINVSETSGSATEESAKDKERSVSLEEANQFLEENRHFARWIAPAVSACVLSVIPLILMGAMAAFGYGNMTEDKAGGFGVAILLFIIAIAVGIMVVKGMPMGRYEYLEKEVISLQYGVQGIVQKKKEAFFKVYRCCTVAGITLCILGVMPLMIAAGLSAGDFVYAVCTAVLLAMIALAVLLFVWSGTIQGGFMKLLQQEDYSVENKTTNRKFAFVPGIYWCTVVAIYLAISLPGNKWNETWGIWPVAGLLYAAIACVLRAIGNKENKG